MSMMRTDLEASEARYFYPIGKTGITVAMTRENI
jgi:hypothetical protein